MAVHFYQHTTIHHIALVYKENRALLWGFRCPWMQFINLDEKDVSHRWSPCLKVGRKGRLCSTPQTNDRSYCQPLFRERQPFLPFPCSLWLAEGKECNWFILSRWNGFYWNVDNKSPSGGCMCCLCTNMCLCVHVCVCSRACICSFVGEVFIVWWMHLNWSI